MLDGIQKLIDRLISQPVDQCPSDQPTNVVSPTALTVVLIVMIGTAVWAFNSNASAIDGVKTEQEQKVSFAQLQDLVKQQQQMQELRYAQQQRQTQERQQIQQQLSENQGELIRSVTTIQATLNMLLRERHPEAFSELDDKIQQTQSLESVEVQRLFASFTNSFIKALENESNKITPLSEQAQIYLLGNETGDIAYTFAPTENGRVKLFIDTNQFETDLTWSSMQTVINNRLSLQSQTEQPE